MDQDVEYDSVADLRVPVSDDEYSDSFADDMMEVPSPGFAGNAPPGFAGQAGPAVSVVQADDAMGVSTTPSRSPGRRVSGSTTSSWSRGDVPREDPRVENVTVPADVPSSKPRGFWSSFSRRFLPSFFNYEWPQSAPVTTDVAASTLRPTEARARRSAMSHCTQWCWRAASFGRSSVSDAC